MVEVKVEVDDEAFEDEEEFEDEAFEDEVVEDEDVKDEEDGLKEEEVEPDDDWKEEGAVDLIEDKAQLSLAPTAAPFARFAVDSTSEDSVRHPSTAVSRFASFCCASSSCKTRQMFKILAYSKKSFPFLPANPSLLGLARLKSLQGDPPTTKSKGPNFRRRDSFNSRTSPT